MILYSNKNSFLPIIKTNYLDYSVDILLETTRKMSLREWSINISPHVSPLYPAMMKKILA